jgi:hypothetical protein
MSRIPLISADTFRIDLRRLPTFYMEDFSLMGLKVHPLKEALRVLETTGARVHSGPAGHELELASAATLPEWVAKLREEGVGCEIADIAEALYQG